VPPLSRSCARALWEAVPSADRTASAKMQLMKMRMAFN